MTLIREKSFEEELYKYLKENKGTAYALSALGTVLKKFLRKVNKKERSNVIQEILDSMIHNEKIGIIEHNGELHYFYLKIFDYEKYKRHNTHYIIPEFFISVGKGKKKIKIKYCKSCKKEVILTHRYRQQEISFWFPTLSYLSEKNTEARKKTGWFCPNCNRKF